ncbi:hypothetical protein [Acinetobacter sp. ANC 4639]
MMQSKSMSLRILPSPQKAGLKPAVYLLIGFFSGTLLGGSVVYIWAVKQSASVTRLPPKPTSAFTVNATDLVNTSVIDTSTTLDNSTDHIAQPQDSELSNIFRHKPSTNAKAIHNKTQHAHANLSSTTQTSPFPVTGPTTTSAEGQATPAADIQTENNQQISLHIAVTQPSSSAKENQ